ncbi:MAG: glycosyltransferase [Armatimonadota bacterium]|nr:glycosyltransferase [Armatimonadota bacterium]
MKRLLFLITGLGYGGAETQLVRLASRLLQRGWSIQMVSMLPLVAYADNLRNYGIPVHTLKMRRKVPDPRAIGRFARIVRCFRPSVVHAFMVHANLLARVSRLFCRIPVLICSARNTYEGGWMREWAYRLTDPLCDMTTQVCRVGMERYIQRRLAPAHKIVYIPNGIEVNRFTPNPSLREAIRQQLGIGQAFVWLTVGRLEPQKDYPNLLTAFRQVVSRATQPTQLLIVGQGPLRGMIERKVADLELSGAVQLLGVRTDIPALLSAADAFVLASSWEGMSNALLEAAAAALPIVATSVGGAPEIVAQQMGYLVPPRDADALAQAMLRLMALPEAERHAMGQAGRMHTMANFDLEKVVDEWEQLYLQLLERKGLVSTRNPQSESC